GEVQVQRALSELWAGRLDVAAEEAQRAEADMQWLACSAEMEMSAAMFRVIEAAMRGDAEGVERRLQSLYTREDASTDERRRLWQHQMAIYGVRMTDVLGGDEHALRRWAAHLLERPLEDASSRNTRSVATRARYAAAQGRWADAMAGFDELLPKANNMDVNGQAIELHLRCAHARLRCGRLADAAQAATPALQRMRDEDERGHALMCGTAVLDMLAATDWGPHLAAELQDELRASTALATRLRRTARAADASPLAEVATRDEALAAVDGEAVILSAREREVLERIAAGDSNKLIARALDISPHTVKRHVANILDKLDLTSRGQAGAWLRENAAG
ncbi:MAG: helix-turn-helix transcriptional regulator, partial [Rhizobacter sp.]